MKKVIVGLLVMIGIAGFVSESFAAKVLQVKGSDTLINVAQRLSELYMEKNSGKMIAVTGGGSGTGIAALINRSCDIANSSRSIKDTEVAQAVANGVDVKRVVVAIDALSVIVNEENSIKELTVEQIAKIYRGEVKNWKDLGGEDRPITLYGRQPNSGTYDFMKENILKAEYSGKMNQMNGNAQIVEAVKQDKGGIGYVGLGYLKDSAGIVAVKVAMKAGGTYIDPLNIADVKAGKYPITRALNQYVNGMPKGDALDFIRFELSEEGQKIVEEEGFMPLNEEYQDLNSWVIKS